MADLNLHGAIPPLVTPMHPDGSLHLERVPVLVDYMLARGVHGIFTAGSQGEAFALDADERLAMLEATLAAVNGRVPVIAGTGAITTRDAVAMSRQAEQAGASAIAVLTPFFITPTQAEMLAHFHAVAEVVTLPVLGYSNPGRTGGVRLLPETLAQLAAEIPHFVGVKDSSGDLTETAAIIRTCPPDFKVFVGRDTLIYAALSHGAAGTVALTANVVPQYVSGIYDAFQSGDLAHALELQRKVATLRERLPQIGSYPAQVKAALALLGVSAGPPRLPIQPLDEAAQAELRILLRSIDLEV